MESRGIEELQKEQQRWRDAEKTRLVKLAREKAADMKSEAAKALEPELRKIVEQHNENLQVFREENESKLQNVKEQLQEENLHRLEREMHRIDQEEELACLEVDEYFKHKLTDLTAQLEDKVKVVKETMKKDREDVVASLQVKMETEKREHRKELSYQEKDCENEIRAARKVMEAKVKQMEHDSATAVEIEKQKLDSGMEQWKAKESLALRAHFEDLAANDEEKLKQKAEGDVVMIMKKLSERLEAKKAEMNNLYESESKVSRNYCKKLVFAS